MRSDVYETGTSDHHKMILSILRKTFAKEKPKKKRSGVIITLYGNKAKKINHDKVEIG